MKCLYLTSDLMFSSRVTSLARDAGREVVVVPSTEALADELSGEDVRLVVIDLTKAAGILDAVMEAVQASDAAPTVIAYGPHVDEATLAAARAAGCDEVLPRSQFNARIPEILASHLPETE